MAVTNQRGRIGLKNVMIATLNESTDITGGTPTWNTLTPLAAVAELSYDPGSSIASYFGDNALIAAGETVGEQKVSLKLLDVIPATMALALGMTYALGQLIYNSGNISPYVAIVAQVLMNGQSGGQPVYENIVLYKCMFQKPKKDMKTKGKSIAFQEVQLDGLVVSLMSNGNYMLTQRSDDNAGSAAAMTNWFTTVQLPGADLTPLTVVASKSGTTLQLTFSKGSGLSFSLDAATVILANLLVYCLGVIKQPGALTLPGSAGTTQLVTIAGYTATDILTIVFKNSLVKDTNNVAVNDYSVSITI